MAGKLEDRVREIIVDQLGVNAEQVTPEASFIDDLGADSLDSVELIMAFEEEFGAAIPEEDAEKLTTVGKDDRDRDVRALKRLRRGTDNIRFAVASERRKRIRIDGRVAEFDLRGLFREEDRSRRGGRKFSPRVLRVCAVLDEVAARSVGERSENRGVHDRADAVAVDRNASVDELFNRFFKDAFVKRRTGAHTATDKDDRTIRALVVIEGVGRDREGLL